MGLAVEGHPAVAVDDPSARPRLLIHLVDVGGHVVKALRPEEKAVSGIGRPPHREIPVQGGVGLPGGEAEIPGPALGVKAAGHRHRLQQGGLARSVLPHKEGHVGGDLQGMLPVPQRPHRRQGGQIAARRDRLPQIDAVEIAMGHGLTPL